MFDAQILRAESGLVQSVYGPWMQRGGDNMRAVLDVIAIVGSNTSFNVAVYHKAAEDAGDGASTGSTISTTVTGRPTAVEWSGLKDLVRFKFTLDNGENLEDAAWVLFRMLPVVWFDSVDV